MSRSQLISIFFAVVLVALAAAYGGQKWTQNTLADAGDKQNEILYRNNLASCERGNKIRAESNKRAIAHRRQDEAIDLIAANRAAAWRREYKKTGDKFDLVAARTYDKAHDLVATLKFDDDPPVNCKQTVMKPPKLKDAT